MKLRKLKLFLMLNIVLWTGAAVFSAPPAPISAPTAPSNITEPQYNTPTATQNLEEVIEGLDWTEGTDTASVEYTAKLSTADQTNLTFKSYIYNNIKDTILYSGEDPNTKYSSSQTTDYPTKGTIITSKITGFKKVSKTLSHVDFSSGYFPLVKDSSATDYYIPVGTTTVQNSGYDMKKWSPFNFYTRLSFYSSADEENPEAVYMVKNGALTHMYNPSSFSESAIEWSPAYITESSQIKTYDWSDSSNYWIPAALVKDLPYIKVEHVVDYSVSWAGGDITNINIYNPKALYSDNWATFSSIAVNFFSIPVLDWVNSTKSSAAPNPWGTTTDSGSMTYSGKTGYYAKLYDQLDTNKIVNDIFLPYVNDAMIGSDDSVQNMEVWSESLGYLNATIYYIMKAIYTDIDVTTLKGYFSDSKLVDIVSAVQYINGIAYANVDNIDSKTFEAAYKGIAMYNNYIQERYHYIPDVAWTTIAKYFGWLYNLSGRIEDDSKFISGSLTFLLDGILVLGYPSLDSSALESNTTSVVYADLIPDGGLTTPESPNTKTMLKDYYKIVDQWYYYGIREVASETSKICNEIGTSSGTSTEVLNPINVDTLDSTVRNILQIIAYITVDSKCSYNSACINMYFACLAMSMDITNNLQEGILTMFQDTVKDNPTMAAKYEQQLTDISSYLSKYFDSSYEPEIKELNEEITKASKEGTL